MDKYEYKLKTEQMLELMEKGVYNKAAEIADTIDWKRVRNATMLTNVGDIYEKTGDNQKSYEVLNIAYHRAEGSRKVIYRLCALALKTGNVDEAIDYYDDFVQAAPKDPNQHILRYKILRARRAPVEQQIEALEEFKKAEYIEEWAYELAKLYQEAGLTAECLEECDDLILWFSEGKFVYKAMELKMQYKQLTPSQQEKYDHRFEKIDTDTDGGTEEIPNVIEYAAKKETQDETVQIEVASVKAALENEEPLQRAARIIAEESYDTDHESEEPIEELEDEEEAIEESQTQEPEAEELEPEEQEPEEELPEEVDETIQRLEEKGIGSRMKLKDALKSLLQPKEEEETPELEEAIEQIEAVADLGLVSGAAVQPIKERFDADLEELKAEPEPEIIEPQKVEPEKVEPENIEPENVEPENVEPENIEPEEIVQESSTQESSTQESKQIDTDQVEGQISIQDLLTEWDNSESAKEDNMEDKTKKTEPILPPDIQRLIDEIEGIIPEGTVSETEELEEAIELPEESILIPEETLEEDLDEVEDLDDTEDFEEEDLDEWEDFEEENLEEVEDFEEEEDLEEVEDFGDEEDLDEAEDFDEEELDEAEDLEEEDLDEVEGFGEEEDLDEAEDFEEEELDEWEDFDEAETFEPEVFEEEEDFDEVEEFEMEDFEVEDEFAQPEDFEVETELDEWENFEEEEELDDWDEEEEDFSLTLEPEKELDDREIPDEEDEMDILSATTPLSRKETAKMIATGKTAPLPVDEISDALSLSNTGYIVHGRYDLESQSGIGTRAGLTDDQKKLFSYFVPVRGMSEQLVDVLEQDHNCTNRENTSRTGNLLIIGNKGNGKTVLAVDVVKAIQKQRNIKQGKVAIVTGDSLNKKKISEIFSKLHGGALIIEKAGRLNEKTVARLNKAMERDTGELLIVLEEQRKPLDRLLSSNREFRRKFTSRLEVPIFINDELVTFGQTYAQENGYRIDEMGILALYSRIDAMQREDHAVTITEVKEVMDDAMQYSQKASAKKLVKRVFGRNTDESDRIILSEKDFN